MLERRGGKVSSRLKTIIDPTRERNLLLNSSFQVAQRGAGPHTNAAASATNAVNNDDAYILDQWVFLADGADTCDISKDTTDLPSAAGAGACIALDVETANRKFGIIQFLENENTIPLRGQKLSLSFYAKVTGTSISNIRAAVLAWDGTANTITSDVVSAWNASGSNPTLVGNWTAENTASNLSVSSSWTLFEIEDISFDTSGANNLAVFIWTDDTDATTGDILRITCVKLEIGSVCTPYVPQNYQTELTRCQRYFYGFRALSANRHPIAVGVNDSATDAYVHMKYPTPMLKFANVSFSAAADFELLDKNGFTALTVITDLSWADTTGTIIQTSVGGGFVAGESVILHADDTQTAYIDVSAEL